MIKVLGLYWDVLVLPKDFNSVAVEDVWLISSQLSMHEHVVCVDIKEYVLLLSRYMYSSVQILSLHSVLLPYPSRCWRRCFERERRTEFERERPLCLDLKFFPGKSKTRSVAGLFLYNTCIFYYLSLFLLTHWYVSPESLPPTRVRAQYHGKLSYSGNLSFVYHLLSRSWRLSNGRL
jgi:hypothetical protein